MDTRHMKGGHSSLLDDLVETCLEDWSGLRLYLKQRRKGRPIDNTMEALLAEVLRTKLPREADLPGAMRYLTSHGR